MPRKTPRPCKHPYCPNTTREGKFCKEHSKQRGVQVLPQIESRAAHKRRNSSGFYNGAGWQKTRRAYKTRHPLCERCSGSGDLVDHIVPIRSGGEKYKFSNLQTLCARCHAQKHASEDSGLGAEGNRLQGEDEGEGG